MAGFNMNYFAVALGPGGFLGPDERIMGTGFFVLPFICPYESRLI